MNGKTLLWAVCILAAATVSCGPSTEMPAPGVSIELAQQRAAVISNPTYRLHLRIPDDPNEEITGGQEIQLSLVEPVESVVVDFQVEKERLRTVSLDGNPVAYRFENGHVIVDKSLPAGDLTLQFDFLAGDKGMNRREEYLYTLFVPDRASTIFPCFDQPDIKARFELSLETPDKWTSISNGPEEASQSIGGNRKLVRFTGTAPISTYLFAFAAGLFQVQEYEVRGEPIRMLHRETDADKLLRNGPRIFELHARALEWLEQYTGIEYPFEKFDFVLIPDFQFGGMEHPGSIWYRASRLLLEEAPSQEDSLNRASLIAHETAHMWFGNLVTMEWFDDVWMKEVFANFMAAKIVNPSFPELDHNLRFFLAHHPSANSIDRTEGTHPVRQRLENMKDAASLYGAIIYQKAPIVMRQLEQSIGEAAFREGVREYLETFRFGNASWRDLVSILDQKSETNLAAWSDVWIEQAGRPEITPLVKKSSTGEILQFEINQLDPLGMGRFWRQKMSVSVGGEEYGVELGQQRTRLKSVLGIRDSEPILLNSDGLGYGLFHLDPETRDHLLFRQSTISDPLVRAVSWMSLWEEMLDAEVRPITLFKAIIRELPDESNELVGQFVLDTLVVTYWQFLSSGDRDQIAPELERMLWGLLGSDLPSSYKSALFRVFRETAITTEAVGKLEAIWAGKSNIKGLTLGESDLTDLYFSLVLRGAESVLNQSDLQRERITDDERVQRFEFLMPAASADFSVRSHFFEGLKAQENRLREPWVLAGMRLINHPIRGNSSVNMITEALELLEEIKETGTIFFPQRWLNSLLWGRRTEREAELVTRFLEQLPVGYPPRLRMKILQEADLLLRAVASSQNLGESE